MQKLIPSNMSLGRMFLFVIFILGGVLWSYKLGYAQEYAGNLIYAKKSAIWRTQQISVCWENINSSTVVERGWVMDTVNDTWAANSSLNFTGWGICDADSNGIRIRIADAGPHTKGLGTELAGNKDGMVLNFTFNNFSKNYCQNSIETGRREHCIRVIAMHEFGHALGFAHEQNRPDAPEWCKKEAQGGSGDMLVTDFDLKSVMNYCNNASWPSVVTLSDFDIIGLQRVYGRPGESLPTLDSIFAVNLTALHPGCDSEHRSRSAECVSAMHRVCLGAGRGGAGVSQEVGNNVFGVACFNPTWYGIVSLDTLKEQHAGCNNVHSSQEASCVSAVHRWCAESGNGSAGLVQEVGDNVFGVACFNPTWYGIVSLDTLKEQHAGCNNVHSSQEASCVSAVHRWCVGSGNGSAGLVQEVGDNVFGVACFNPTWYGNVLLRAESQAMNAISNEEGQYPWEKEVSLDDELTSIYFRLPESYILKLQYISEISNKSQQELIEKVLLPYIDEYVNELVGTE